MMEARQQADRWAKLIAEGYAAGTTPPITPHLTDELRKRLADGLTEAIGRAEGAGWADAHVNPVLDAWERRNHVVGPRLESVDEAAGTVHMAHRSEAGHPLRPFGGQ